MGTIDELIETIQRITKKAVLYIIAAAVIGLTGGLLIGWLVFA